MNRSKAAERTDYKVFRTLTTRWFDNDVYGHMNNTVHYELFDTAVNGFLIEEGILNPRSSKTVFLVVSSGCSYFSELAFPDVIHAGLKITKLGASSVTYEIALFSEKAPLAAAVGQFVHVNVDRDHRRPVEISQGNRVLLNALM